jgi:hypothetical protein
MYLNVLPKQNFIGLDGGVTREREEGKHRNRSHTDMNYRAGIIATDGVVHTQHTNEELKNKMYLCVL